MPEEVMEYAGPWIGHNGRLDFGYNFTYHNFSQYVSYSITDLAEELGIKERVVFVLKKYMITYADLIYIRTSWNYEVMY